jgi:hypothetical protein
LRIDSPCSSSRCAACTRRSKILSAIVGSPICACHLATGNWLVSSVARQIPLIADLEKRPPLGVCQWSHRPIVHDQSNPLGLKPEASSRSCHPPSPVPVLGSREAVAARFLSKRPRQKRFHDPSRTYQENVLLAANPVRLVDQGSITCLSKPLPAQKSMSSMHAGPCRRASLSRFSRARSVAKFHWRFTNSAKRSSKLSCVFLWIFLLLSEGVSHRAHAHGVQLLDRLLVEHVSPCGLLNHRRIGLLWGIEVIGAADIIVLHGRLNGSSPGSGSRSSWFLRIESMLWKL